MERINEAELTQRMAAVKEGCKKSLKNAEAFQMYQDVLAFTASEGKEDAPALLIRFLPVLHNERLFTAVLSEILERGAVEQLHPFLLAYLTDPGNLYRQSALDILLRDRGTQLEKVIMSCRASQSLTEEVLGLANRSLVQTMRRSAVTSVNFTPTALLALKCVESGVSGNLLQEALRHLLIVDCVQQGQISKLLMENERVLGELEKMGRRDSVSGYWYFLVAKLYSNEVNRNSAVFYQWAEAAFLKGVKNVAEGSSLRDQIDKIAFSGFDEKRQLDLLTQLRGLTFFLTTCINVHIQEGTHEPRFLTLIEQLMELKDFACFEYAGNTYLQALAKGQLELNANTVRSIQQNCLPIFHSSNQIAYNPTEVRVLSLQFDPREGIKISAEASTTMGKLLQRVLQWRGCSHKRAICNCCEEYIRVTIQKQYDHEFHSHQFMSACHLMCRQVSRITSTNPEPTQAQALKEYLLEHIKWLLNLSESCLPKHRRCVSFAIFDLLLVFPPLLARNHFLQAVIADLFVSRLPNSLTHLARLLALFNNDPQLASDPRKDLERLGEKLLQKCGEENLGLENQIKIWDLLIGIWEKDQSKLAELLEVYSLHGDHSLAKYMAMKRRKTPGWEKLEARAKQEQQRMEQHRFFYSHELGILHSLLKIA